MAVGDAVVGGERRRHHRTRRDVSIDDGRLCRHPAETDDRYLRRIDDAVKTVDAAVAEA